MCCLGSYARGNYTVASDVGLLVVYAGSAREGAFARVKKTLGIPSLEPHVYSEDAISAGIPPDRPDDGGGIVLYPRS